MGCNHHGQGHQGIPHLLAGVGWLYLFPSPLSGAGVPSSFSAEKIDQINIAKVGSHVEGRLTLSLLWVETCLLGGQKLCHILKVILCS